MQLSQPQLVNTFRCNRDWNSMPITANGRYCSGCKKEVRDFTGLEPEQILQVLSENAGKVCSRIDAQKVQHRPELHFPEPEIAWHKLTHWYRVAAAAAGAFLMLFSGKATAQTVNEPNVTTSPAAERQVAFKAPVPTATDTLSEKNVLYVLKGKVIDAASKEEIPFANVVVLQKGKQLAGAAADFDGKFEVSLDPELISGNKIDLEIASVGYLKKEIKSLRLPAKRELTVELEGIAIMGLIVIEYACPQIVDPWNPPGTRTYTKEEIQRSPNR